MAHKIADLRNREVINVRTGERLGFVSDVQFDIVEGKVSSIIVPGQSRLLGIFGRFADRIIPYECIKRIGDELILIDMERPEVEDIKRRRFL